MYQRTSIELKVEPMKKASAYFNEQTKQLRDVVEVAQSRLSKYQQENGIVSIDNRLDVESNRLNDLSAQLVMAQGMAMEANSRRNMANGTVDSPDVNANPLIQSLKLGLGQAEAKLADIGERMGKNHPQYESTKAEVEKLRASLRENMKSTSSGVGGNAAIMQQREGAIRAAMAAQKAKVLELNRKRDEMNVLVKDVESAQRAFDAASQRFSQTKIEGQAEQSDISVLNPAVPPIQPSSPRVLANTLISIFLGTLLGLGLGLVVEMLNRRVRSTSDLADVMQIPVLGSVEWKERPPRRFGKALLPRRLRLN